MARSSWVHGMQAGARHVLDSDAARNVLAGALAETVKVAGRERSQPPQERPVTRGLYGIRGVLAGALAAGLAPLGFKAARRAVGEVSLKRLRRLPRPHVSIDGLRELVGGDTAAKPAKSTSRASASRSARKTQAKKTQAKAPARKRTSGSRAKAGGARAKAASGSGSGKTSSASRSRSRSNGQHANRSQTTRARRS